MTIKDFWHLKLCSGCGKSLEDESGWCDECRLEVFGTLLYQEWDGDIRKARAKWKALRERHKRP